MRVPTAVVVILSVVFSVGMSLGGNSSARASALDSDTLVFDLDDEDSVVEHDANALWNITGDNIVRDSVTASWLSTYEDTAGVVSGELIVNLEAGTLNGEIAEYWDCGDDCERWATRDTVIVVAIQDASVEPDAGGWAIAGDVAITYRAYGGYDETPSDCGGTECYICDGRYCTFDTTDEAVASLEGRLEGTTLTLAFMDGLEADAHAMDLSGLRRTVFFMSRFEVTVVGRPADAAASDDASAPAADDDASSAGAEPVDADEAADQPVDAAVATEATTDDETATEVEADEAVGMGAEVDAETASQEGAAAGDEGGLGGLFLGIALVVGAGGAALLLRALLKKPSPEPAAAASPSGPTEERPTAAAPVVKIGSDEVKRMVAWGVEHNRTPDDIRRDVDARNQSLGGTGVVPIPNMPKRIKLPQGEVTVTPEEYAEYGRRTTDMADQLDNAKIHRGVMEKLAAKSRFWSAVDKAVIVRWIAGTKKIYDQGLIINHPGRWLASKGGYDDVDDMLAKKYGKPTWMNYQTHRYGSLDQAVDAWKAERNGGWERYQADRSKAIDDARRRLRTMMARPEPTGATKQWGWTTTADRVFLGPNVEAPRELFPSRTPAVQNMSWYNRPSHELKQILEAQRQSADYLRQTRQELDRFLKYESDLARRIPTPAG